MARDSDNLTPTHPYGAKQTHRYLYAYMYLYEALASELCRAAGFCDVKRCRRSARSDSCIAMLSSSPRKE